MEVVNAGTEYRIGDTIEFINVFGGYGTGAVANVTNVNTANANSITEVKFVKMPGHIIGGSGYDINYLPTTNIGTSTGSNGSIITTAVLGTGAILEAANSALGSIERIIITNRGAGYVDPTIADLSGYGDGTATANVDTIGGVFSYPGRYLNDDGHISSYNFLQDRDYYQTFSYVIRIKKSISLYRKAIFDLVHPSGTKLFGEYIFLDETENYIANTGADDAKRMIILTKSYTKTGNSVNISYVSHSQAANANVYLEFRTGGYANVTNGIYRITSAAANYFLSTNKTANTNNTSGNVEVGIILT
jgi:hypothetical protein